MSLASFLGLDSRNPGECIVRIGGSEFKEFYPNLQSTVVTLKRKESCEAVLTFITLRDESGAWAVAEDPRVRAWARIEIVAVFGDVEEPFFNGYIREIRTSVPESGSVASVTLNCQDSFAAMDRECRQHNYEEGRDSLDIIREVIAPYGVTLVTNMSGTPFRNWQQNKTDYRFIRELALPNCEWYLRANSAGFDELHYAEPQTTAEASGKKLMLHAGRETNCLTLDISHDAYQPDSIKAATTPVTGDQPDAISSASNQDVMGTAPADSTGSGLRDFAWCQPPVNSNNVEMADATATARANELSFKLRATGKLDGTVYGGLLLPATVVEVGGAGHNNGKWYVDTTTHRFDDKGYFVDFELIRNAAAGDEASSDHILSGVI